MNHIEAIEAGLEARTPYHEIARKIYLTYPTKVFIGHEEKQFVILDAIANFFDVPITSVQVAGSAKTGRSFHQRQDFRPGESDLDVAVIDNHLFTRYSEDAFRLSRGYSDHSVFPVREGASVHEEYTRYLARGVFRPDLMPTGPSRARVNNFFGRLSTRHSDLFSSITGAIYMSQVFFENKQRSAIKSYVDTKAI
ncbi:MAG: hypothetical protein QM702_12625 [Rubrivivax sp.]